MKPTLRVSLLLCLALGACQSPPGSADASDGANDSTAAIAAA